VAVLPPDVNESQTDFTVVRDPKGRKVIRFGLGAVKKVGETAVQAIIEERTASGPFGSVFDLCARVDLRRVNKGVVEALVKASAFDSLVADRPELHRARVLSAVPTAVDRGNRAQKEKRSGQTNLLDLFGGGGGADAAFGSSAAEEYPELEPWSPRQLLDYEKESLGLYISGHPLDRYLEDLQKFTSHRTAELAGLHERAEVTLGGMVADYRERPLKSGDGRIAFFNLEDLHGKVEVMVGSKQLEELGEILKADEPILLTGWLRLEGEDDVVTPKLRVKEISRLADMRMRKTREVHLTLTVDLVDRARLEKLRTIIAGQRGECRVYLHLVIPHHSETVVTLPESLMVAPTDDLLLHTERLFGEKVAVLR
jgi:DNA polymerase-3 subunit alpha